ncbi:MAG: hypothetical protein K0S33_859 [Bacteroidetes bacterium]|jgi:hypothetical protein|nr:hypothetical protein [Bacteroidota bacterium]
MAKFTLDIEFDFDFMLFAIAAHEPDYKICFKLNQVLGIDLHKEEPIELKNKNQQDNLLFSLYCYTDEAEQLEYNLLSNKSYNAVLSNKSNRSAQADLFGETEPELAAQKGFLINELSNADYLLIVRNSYDATAAYETEQKLRTVEGVINVQFVEVSELASKNNLIF